MLQMQPEGCLENLPTFHHKNTPKGRLERGVEKKKSQHKKNDPMIQ